MALLETSVQRDEVFERRRERMEGLVAELHERSAEVARGGGEKATERLEARRLPVLAGPTRASVAPTGPKYRTRSPRRSRRTSAAPVWGGTPWAVRGRSSQWSNSLFWLCSASAPAQFQSQKSDGADLTFYWLWR